MDGLTRDDGVRNCDLRFDRIEQFLPTLATKDSLQTAVEKLATKDELQAEVAKLATKDELQAAVATLATKDELHAAVANMATKEELRAEVRTGDSETRHYMKCLVEELRGDIRNFGEGLAAMNARQARDYTELVQADAHLDRRVTALEAGRRRARSR